MTGGVRILDSSGNSVGTTGDNLKVTLPSIQQAGFTGLAGMNDPAGNVRIPIAGSSQGLLGMAEVNVDFEEAFVGNSISLTKWKYLATTMTIGFNNNLVIMNAGNSVASGTNATIQSYKVLEFVRGADRVIAWRARITAVVTGVVVEIGALVNTTGTAAPTGGAFFRLNAAGELRGVVVTVAGSEIETAPIDIPSVFALHDWMIVVTTTGVYFQIDNVVVGSIAADSLSPAPVVAEWAFAAVRLYNNTAVSQAVQVQVARCVTAYFGGSYQHRGEFLAALAGDVGSQAIPGVAGSYLANWANSAVPAPISLSNTGTGYTNLGGQFIFSAVAAAETDYNAFTFQVPAGSVTSKPSTLLIHGITIDTFVVGAAVGTTTIFQWGIGYGGTQVSLAAADGNTAKAVRRVPVGIQSLAAGAAIGAMAVPISRTFTQPLPVNPGEYFNLILKMPTGAATASLSFRGLVGIDATWV